MATKERPTRRNDVIRCENCGEDYSITYKRCPFCDERPGRGGRRVATNTRGGGYGGGGGANPFQIAVLVGSLVLIIAALYIVFTLIAPMLGKGSSSSSSSGSGTGGGTSQSTDSSSSQSDPAGSGDVSQGGTETPDPSAVTSISLNREDFSLPAGQSWTLTATVSPATATVTWESSNPSAATVSADGTVTNVSTASSTVNVTITATAGDKSASCIVRCKAGSSGGSSTGGSTGSSTGGTVTSGTVGTVTGAGSGLKIRSGPGTDYEVLASTTNGSQLTILEDAGNGWYKISYSAGGGATKTGYVSKDYVKVG